MSGFDVAVAAGAVLLALRSKFVRRHLARLLKRLRAVRVGVVSLEFDQEPRPAAGPEAVK